MSVYTMEDWRNDSYFQAKAGQEVEFEIYEQMFNCMPPIRLPRCEQTADYSSGFLMGEPNDFDPVTHKTRYLAFGRKNKHYYYIGLLSGEGA